MHRKKRSSITTDKKGNSLSVNVKQAGKVVKKQQISAVQQMKPTNVKCSKCSKSMLKLNNSKSVICVACLKKESNLISTKSKKIDLTQSTVKKSKQKSKPARKNSPIKSNSKPSKNSNSPERISRNILSDPSTSRSVISTRKTNVKTIVTKEQAKTKNITAQPKSPKSLKSPSKTISMHLRGNKRSYVHLASGVEIEDKKESKKRKIDENNEQLTKRGNRNKKPTVKGSEWLNSVRSKRVCNYQEDKFKKETTSANNKSLKSKSGVKINESKRNISTSTSKTKQNVNSNKINETSVEVLPQSSRKSQKRTVKINQDQLSTNSKKLNISTLKSTPSNNRKGKKPSLRVAKVSPSTVKSQEVKQDNLATSIKRKFIACFTEKNCPASSNVPENIMIAQYILDGLLDSVPTGIEENISNLSLDKKGCVLDSTMSFVEEGNLKGGNESNHVNMTSNNISLTSEICNKVNDSCIKNVNSDHLDYNMDSDIQGLEHNKNETIVQLQSPENKSKSDQFKGKEVSDESKIVEEDEHSISLNNLKEQNQFKTINSKKVENSGNLELKNYAADTLDFKICKESTSEKATLEPSIPQINNLKDSHELDTSNLTVKDKIDPVKFEDSEKNIKINPEVLHKKEIIGALKLDDSLKNVCNEKTILDMEIDPYLKEKEHVFESNQHPTIICAVSSKDTSSVEMKEKLDSNINKCHINLKDTLLVEDDSKLLKHNYLDKECNDLVKVDLLHTPILSLKTTESEQNESALICGKYLVQENLENNLTDLTTEKAKDSCEGAKDEIKIDVDSFHKQNISQLEVSSQKLNKTPVCDISNSKPFQKHATHFVSLLNEDSITNCKNINPDHNIEKISSNEIEQAEMVTDDVLPSEKQSTENQFNKQTDSVSALNDIEIMQVTDGDTYTKCKETVCVRSPDVDNGVVKKIDQIIAIENYSSNETKTLADNVSVSKTSDFQNVTTKESLDPLSCEVSLTTDGMCVQKVGITTAANLSINSSINLSIDDNVSDSIKGAYIEEIGCLNVRSTDSKINDSIIDQNDQFKNVSRKEEDCASLIPNDNHTSDQQRHIIDDDVSNKNEPVNLPTEYTTIKCTEDTNAIHSAGNKVEYGNVLQTYTKHHEESGIDGALSTAIKNPCVLSTCDETTVNHNDSVIDSSSNGIHCDAILPTGSKPTDEMCDQINGNSDPSNEPPSNSKISKMSVQNHGAEDCLDSGIDHKDMTPTDSKITNEAYDQSCEKKDSTNKIKVVNPIRPTNNEETDGMCNQSNELKESSCSEIVSKDLLLHENKIIDDICVESNDEKDSSVVIKHDAKLNDQNKNINNSSAKEDVVINSSKTIEMCEKINNIKDSSSSCIDDGSLPPIDSRITDIFHKNYSLEGSLDGDINRDAVLPIGTEMTDQKTDINESLSRGIDNEDSLLPTSSKSPEIVAHTDVIQDCSSTCIDSDCASLPTDSKTIEMSDKRNDIKDSSEQGINDDCRSLTDCQKTEECDEKNSIKDSLSKSINNDAILVTGTELCRQNNDINESSSRCLYNDSNLPTDRKTTEVFDQQNGLKVSSESDVDHDVVLAIERKTLDGLGEENDASENLSSTEVDSSSKNKVANECVQVEDNASIAESTLQEKNSVDNISSTVNIDNLQTYIQANEVESMNISNTVSKSNTEYVQVIEHNEKNDVRNESQKGVYTSSEISATKRSETEIEHNFQEKSCDPQSKSLDLNIHSSQNEKVRLINECSNLEHFEGIKYPSQSDKSKETFQVEHSVEPMNDEINVNTDSRILQSGTSIECSSKQEFAINVDDDDVESMQCNSVETHSSNRMSIDEDNTEMELDPEYATSDVNASCEMKVDASEMNMEVN